MNHIINFKKIIENNFQGNAICKRHIALIKNKIIFYKGSNFKIFEFSNAEDFEESCLNIDHDDRLQEVCVEEILHKKIKNKNNRYIFSVIFKNIFTEVEKKLKFEIKSDYYYDEYPYENEDEDEDVTFSETILQESMQLLACFDPQKDFNINSGYANYPERILTSLLYEGDLIGGVAECIIKKCIKKMIEGRDNYYFYKVGTHLHKYTKRMHSDSISYSIFLKIINNICCLDKIDINKVICLDFVSEHLFKYVATQQHRWDLKSEITHLEKYREFIKILPESPEKTYIIAKNGGL